VKDMQFLFMEAERQEHIAHPVWQNNIAIWLLTILPDYVTITLVWKKLCWRLTFTNNLHTLWHTCEINCDIGRHHCTFLISKHTYLKAHMWNQLWYKVTPLHIPH
jgi:hypothetical protein